MIGKHVVIDTLDNFKAKLDLIPSSAIVLIKDVGQIYAHGTYFGAQKTYSLLTKTADGLAPKGGTSASSLISNVDTEWVLTVTNGENPTWRKLPANAFSSSSYTLPSATVSDLGGIKVGQVYTATFNDLVGLYYKVNIDKNGLAYVHVPWINNPYTASGSGITLKDNVFSLSLNSVTKLDSAIGNKIYAVSLDKNGKLCVSVPWTDTNNIFVGATETKNGSSGMVPAPIANQHNYFLRGDGTWVKPNLSDLNDDIVNGKYLPLSGGSISNSDYGALNILRKSNDGFSGIAFSNWSGINGYLGVGGSLSTFPKQPAFVDSSYTIYQIWHSGTFNPSDYLPLSGGIMNGWIYFKDKSLQLGHNDNGYFEIFNARASYCGLGLWDNGAVKVYTNAKWNDIIHSGNIGSQSVSSAKGLVGLAATTDDFSTYIKTYEYLGLSILTNTSGASIGNIGVVSTVLNIGGNADSRLGRFIFSRADDSSELYWQTTNNAMTAWGTKRKIAFITSNVASATVATYCANWGTASDYITYDLHTANTKDTWVPVIYSGKMQHRVIPVAYNNAPSTLSVLSATKLTTARTLWGQTFDGTSNVNGVLTLGTSYITGNDGADILNSEGQWCYLGAGTSEKGFPTYIDGHTIRIRYGTAHTEGVRISSSGDVGIGTTAPDYKLHVVGSVAATSSIVGGYSMERSFHAGGGGTYVWIDSRDTSHNVKNNIILYDDKTSTKTLTPFIDNTYSLGTSSLRWSNVYSILGNFKGQITNSVATGTSPFNITSTTLNTNLNADLLDGIHANGLLTALSSNITNKVSITIGGTTKNITTLYATYLCSVGTVAPLTGRSLGHGDVYSYHTNANNWTGAPTTYTATIGFGKGTSGTVEICGEWTSGRGLWVRALRDVTDNWYAWDRILTEATYSKVLDNRYYTETEVNNKLAEYLPLAGGVMTGKITFKVHSDDSVWIGPSVTDNTSFLEFHVLDDSNDGFKWTTNLYASSGNVVYTMMLLTGSSSKVATLSLTGNMNATNTVNANNFNSRVATGTQPYACTSTTLNANLNADLLDGYHEESFLRYRNLGSNGGATLWSQIGIRSYHNALPEGLSDLYNYGQVVSLPGSGSRLEIFTNHVGSSQSSGQGGLWWRSGWKDDKHAWQRIIDSGNIGSQSVSYASSAGNANTVDNYHISVTTSAGTDTSTIYFVT